MNAVQRTLEEGKLFFDGATGTYASAIGGFPEGPVEMACLTAPQRVAQLHRAYLRAGCTAIKTNTFAVHIGLAAKDEAQHRAIIRAALRIAREQAGNAFVFADIGPAPDERSYMHTADVFLQEGADCFLFETLPSLDGVLQTARMIRQKRADAFIAVSIASNPDGYTRTGEHAGTLLSQAACCEAVDAVGLNCVCGAYHMKKLMERFAGGIKKTLMAMPNAGYPHVENGRTYYESDPEYYARQTAQCAALGVKIFGGCCGTTPEHMLALREALLRQIRYETGAGTKEEMPVKPCRSLLRQRLQEGKRIVLVELDPPAKPDVRWFMEGALAISRAGADAITIADCPIGRVSMDSSLLACKLRREMGIETLPHMTCRDRNVNATKALLLGLSMEGVHNVLAVTGDPVPAEDRDHVKGVFQFNSKMMARFVRNLESTTAPFFLCGALNVNARNFSAELERAKEKQAYGMEAFLTQPVLSGQAVINMRRAREELDAKIIGGLFPVVSHKNACFLRSEVAGIEVDEAVVSAYKGLDREQGERLAVRLCREAAKAIAPYTDGFYIMTPFQRVELVCHVIESIKGI